ncbi:MAG TPA: 4a-hydroxytetrahydrobiopterin dehydratase [Acidimicrobiia bacterium]
MTRLDDESRGVFLEEHPDWALEGESISRTFVRRDFRDAMGFVTQVALAAEVADHHPDIDIRWNKVTLVLSTHSEGVLTERDTSLASAIDEL